MKVAPVHIVVVCAGITGVGFTVTIVVNVEPTQLPAAPDVGVTVYVAVRTISVGLTSVWLIDD